MRMHAEMQAGAGAQTNADAAQQITLWSARVGESYAALQAAQIHGYIKTLEPQFDGRCRRILGTLVKLACRIGGEGVSRAS